MAGFRKTFTALVASVALCSQASVAAAAAAAPAVNPYAVIGVYGSQASAQVLCGNAAATAAIGAAAAAAAQAPAPGCVLPVVDAPPVVPAQPGPATVIPASGGGIGIWPVLLGLAGIAGLAALIASQNDDDDNDPVPVSPA